MPCRTRVLPLIALAAGLLLPTPLAAQPATPAAGCDVEPRSVTDLAALERAAATPASSPAASPPSTGDPIDDATLAAITATVETAAACLQTGDINRYLALFTDSYILREVLAPEPVAILAGSPPPDATPEPATPAADPDQLTITDARHLPNGRVVARVSGALTAGVAEVVFVNTDGRWLIDAINPIAEKGTPAA